MCFDFKNAPKMKGNAVVFLFFGGYFFGKFREILAKIFHTPQKLLVPAPMFHCNVLVIPTVTPKT